MAWPVLERNTLHFIQNYDQYQNLGSQIPSFPKEQKVLEKMCTLWSQFQQIQSDLNHSSQFIQQMQKGNKLWSHFCFQLSSNNRLLSCHIPSKFSPFECLPLNICRNHENQFDFLVIFKKTHKRRGGFKQIRAALNLYNFQLSAKMQNLHTGDEIYYEFNRLSTLRNFPCFPKLIYPYIVQFKKSHKTKLLSTARTAIFATWVETTLSHVINGYSSICFSTKQQICFFIKRLFSDLALLHQNNVVIRDLKNENFGVTTEGQYLVPVFLDTTGISIEGKSFIAETGTLGFIAPDLIKNPKKTSPAGDMWALGFNLLRFFYRNKKLCTQSSPFMDVLSRLLNITTNYNIQYCELCNKFNRLTPKEIKQGQQEALEQQIKDLLNQTYELYQQVYQQDLKISHPETALDNLLFNLLHIKPAVRFKAQEALDYFSTSVEPEILDEHSPRILLLKDV